MFKNSLIKKKKIIAKFSLSHYKCFIDMERKFKYVGLYTAYCH